MRMSRVMVVGTEAHMGYAASCLFIKRCLSTKSALDRSVREVLTIPKYELLRQRKPPRYFKECRGTPRRELQDNCIDGIRVKPTVNPYVKLTKEKHYWLDNYNSRNWDDWNPHKCFVRGSKRSFNIPEDLYPTKDELGRWHPAKLSGRYVADVKKQYLLNGIPWIWDKDFYVAKSHFRDKEPIGPKIWYIKEFREARIRDAMLKMDGLVFNYRKAKHEQRSHSWLERMVQGMGGADLAADYVATRKSDG